MTDVQSEGGQKGRLKFSLKDQYYSWFNPYYVLDPDSASEMHEALQQLQHGKNRLNVIIGDYQGNYQYLTPVNRLIEEAVGQSTVLSLVREILLLWTGKEGS